MEQISFEGRRFSFRRRPVPVPGDLRIAWRLAVIVIMLFSSRSRKASLAKLHILNDAIRSNHGEQLKAAITKADPRLPWNLRVEPAFARAIDFAVGEKLAAWSVISGRSGLQLTVKGVRAAEAMISGDGNFVEEAKILIELAKAMPENAVGLLLGERRRT